MRGDLNLSTWNAVLAGSASGTVVVSGKPKQSLMFTTASHLQDPVMPPNSPRISARELDLISRWIEAGLPEKSGVIEVAKMSAPDVSIGVSSQDARPTESDVRNAARPRSVLQPIPLTGPAKVVRILDVRSGEVLHSLRKHTDWVLTVRYSPDGLLLASGDRFGGLFVWEPVGGEQFHGLRGHSGPVHVVAWDEDNETLVSAGDDGMIRTWNMHHGEQTSSS